MYLDHFHLRTEPFSISPDPRFLYLSESHREALAHLNYGFAHGGFVLITGEVGTGKTTLLRNLIKRTPPELDVAFILNPRLTVRDLLATLCDELGFGYEDTGALTVKQYIDVLNRHLLKTHQSGRSTVMIIDEAQNLSPAVLEQIRLLTNLETDEKKLLRIILLGQPELITLLERKELRQLAQRITARYHLTALSRDDTFAYVIHRLTRAGGGQIFTRGALNRLHRFSQGIPRVINVIADRSLLGAFVEGRQEVTSSIVDRAAQEVLGMKPKPHRLWLSAGITGLAVAGVAWAYFGGPPSWNTEPVKITDPVTVVAQEPETPAETQPAEPVALTSPLQQDTVEPSPPPAEVASASSPPSLPDEIIIRPESSPPRSEEIPSPQPTDNEIVIRPGHPPQTGSGSVSRPEGDIYRAQRVSYAEVFRRWGADYEETGPTIPCDFAPSAGLQCLTRHGTWQDIIQLNLPVVLELRDTQARPFYGAVTRLDRDRIHLVVGSEEYDVTPGDLQDLWAGTFVVLWQMPPDYQGNLTEGERHPTVGWLRSHLANLLDTSLPATDPELFDTGLEEAVVEFQQRNGLVTDGVVGPATWIQLAQALNLPAPALKG